MPSDRIVSARSEVILSLETNHDGAKQVLSASARKTRLSGGRCTERVTRSGPMLLRQQRVMREPGVEVNFVVDADMRGKRELKG